LKILKKIVPIIILSKEEPSDLPEHILALPSIIFKKGSVTNRKDLEKCQIRTAAKIVILSDPYQQEIADADSSALMGYMDICNLAKNSQILMELVHEPNLRFLRKGHSPWLQSKQAFKSGQALGKDDKGFYKPDYYIIPEFASGQVCTFATMDSLLCQIYYQDHLVDVAKELVFGINGLNKVMTTHESEAQSHTQCYCTLVHVPPSYHGRRYGELFNEFINGKNLLPLGLYRCREMAGAPLPYVFTAPPSTTILHENDQVYALSHRLP